VRHFRRFLVWLSLTLCGAILLLWPMSLVVTVWLQVGPLSLDLTDHTIRCHLETQARYPWSLSATQCAWIRPFRAEAWRHAWWDWPRVTIDKAFGGFPLPPAGGWPAGGATPTSRSITFVSPLAPLASGSLAVGVSIIAARRLTRIRRGRNGQCLACGYSLQGVTADRCPECGTKKSPGSPGTAKEQAPADARA
jgi:hypothetical protein